MTLLTDLFGDFLPPPRVSRFDTLTTLSFAPIHHSRVQPGAEARLRRRRRRRSASRWRRRSSRVAALAIRADLAGPVLFRQTRCGLNGRRFEILKLRTMCANAEQRLDELLHLNEMDGPGLQDQGATRGSRGSGACCAATASTRCRSSGTCCAAT